MQGRNARNSPKASQELLLWVIRIPVVSGGAVLTAAGLSFPGVSVRRRPSTLGAMLNDSVSLIYAAPLLMLPPGMALLCVGPRAIEASQIEAYNKPFTAATGIQVRAISADDPAVLLRAQVEARNVTSDESNAAICVTKS